MVFFLPRLAMHDFYLRLPNATFYGGREDTAKNFHFSTTIRIQLRENSPHKLDPVKPFQSNLNTSQTGKLPKRPKRAAHFTHLETEDLTADLRFLTYIKR